MLETLRKYRRDLHQIPELEFDLFKTSAYVKKELLDLGYEVFESAKTGLVAFKKGRVETSIAFRSDMDALPINENTKREFKSKHKGKMHACGHDGHMAMLLGFAKYMASKTLINENLVLIFQPAEEGPGGARVMVEEGIIERFKISKIFGMHLYPGLDEGVFGSRNEVMMAKISALQIKVKGSASHGAEPHLGIDAIVAASSLVSQIQTIVSRRISPLDSGVITLGTINGGSAMNVVADEVSLSGTIRTFDDLVYTKVIKALKDIKEGIELSYGVIVELDIIEYYPSVNNDSILYKEVTTKFNKDNYVELKPLSFSEDFSFFQQVIPGFFIMLGTRNEDLNYTYPLHNDKFDFNEEVLLKGYEYYLMLTSIYNLIKA